MSVLYIEVFTSDSCVFCIKLKEVLNRLIKDDKLKFPVYYKEADISKSVPYTIKYLSNGKSQILNGFPIKDKLFRFLELDLKDDEIYDQTTRKHRKVFKIN